jgi:hydrogenase expression/formation protein HypC
MCLAIPVRVVELREGDQAMVDVGGVRKEISLALVDGIAVGDYVILHVGYAIQKLDPEEAEKTLALFAELGETWERRRREVHQRIPRRQDRARHRRRHRRRDARRPPLPHHGILRRPHPRHLALRPLRPAAGEHPPHPRPRLPGVRAAHRPHRQRHRPRA